MGWIDSLSKRIDWIEDVERDNENQVMLKKKWLNIRAMEKRQLESRVKKNWKIRSKEWWSSKSNRENKEGRS